MGVVAGVALAGTQAGATPPPLLIGISGAIGQTPSSRPARAHALLTSGVECYQKADYESADTYFAQAQAGQAELSETDREGLKTFMQLNTKALSQRREGREVLRKAEEAAAEGRNSEAESYLRLISNNQFLSAEDKVKVQRLSELLGGKGVGTPVMGSNSNQSNSVVARTKLQQARTMMAKGDYAGAEKLANEVEAMHVTFVSEREDTPRKVMDDIARARMPKDSKALLAEAKAALQKGDLDNAERLAQESKKTATSFTYMGWGDSPEKVLKEVQQARLRQAVVLSQNKAKTDSAPKKPDFVKASKPAEPAMPTDPHELLKFGREMLNTNNLDKAEECAQRAKASGGSYGLFKDNPDKLLGDIRKAKKEESVRILMEARKAFDQGQFEEARAKAMRAQDMHGTYTILDRGDRPQKLLQEIDLAQAKAPKPKTLPPVTPMQNAQNPLKEMSPSGTAVKATNNNSSMMMQPAAAVPSNSGGYQIPDMNGQVAGTTTPSISGGLAMSSATDQIPAPPRGGVQLVDHQVPPVDAPAPMPVENPNKPHAMRLMAEAHQAHQSGDLIMARQKTLEAQRLNVQFSVEEDRPEMFLLQLTEAAKKQMDNLCQQATDFTVTANVDATRYKKAEESLVQARRIAAGFALDTQPVDVKMAWVRQTIDRNQGSNPPVMQVQHQETSSDIPSPPSGLNMPFGPKVSNVTVSTAPTTVPAAQTTMPAAPTSEPTPVASGTNQGQVLLDKARQELRKGDTEAARRLAAEAFNGPYGVRDQANAVIHSIDAEEVSQKSLAASRSYEAGLAAYQRHDFALANTIFQSVDPMLLSPEKQAKLRELQQMQEMQTPVRTVGMKSDSTGTGPAVGATRVSDSAGQAKRAPLEETYSQQVQALQEVQFQSLRDKGLQVQREAVERFNAGETDRAIQILETYLDGLKSSHLDAPKVALLRRPVENRLQNFKTLKAQQDFETARAGDAKTFAELRERQNKAELHKQQQVAEQMKLYHQAYKEARYEEALTYARRAHELDPDNMQASTAMALAEKGRNAQMYKNYKNEREEYVLQELDEAEKEGPAATSQEPLKLDAKRMEVARKRGEIQLPTIAPKNEKEREIEHKLIMPLTLDFKNTPLKQVVEDLRTWTGINIVLDKRALEEESVSVDQTVDMKLDGVSLKSALTNVLHQVHLTYVIEDEVLKITTEAHAKGRMVLKTYQVADLVIPIEDHNAPTAAAFAESLGVTVPGGPENRSMSSSGPTPQTGPHSLPTGQQVSGSLMNQQASPTPSTGGGSQAPKKTMEDVLIKLITNTIKPESWDASGGPGTIDYFPLGMALTINQTPDIQEQVQELLHALRRLQDQEVAVEVRFITISEAFFERIGMDFNINIVTNNPKFQNMIVSQQFQPFGEINKITSNAVVGLQPSGQFTNTLDIPITQNSFNLAVPPFGGFPTMPGADGGLSLGLAFLSDIQVFLFMEAAQGDRRTNVMQAPKITLFNGQTSTISVSDLQFFVTNVSFFLVNGQIVFVPSNTPIPTGVNLTMNAVITADRRFVRMSIAPTLTNLSTPVTALFPITTFVTPLFEGGAQGQPVPFTMFLQQPGFTTVTVNTTVMVPDGGTVLMGGLKTLREGRNEFGPPILSKIPYIDRLFKNVGYGRETESLLMMVTPRIIINEEEEFKQTGVGPGGGLAAGGGAEQPQ
jgi:type II secretory pathway component GspD/PulD (secretin)